MSGSSSERCRSRERAAALIGVVGPCSAGKSTLVHRLKAAGYAAKEIAQEHSGVPDMWQRLSHPDVLIYLDVDPAMGVERQGLRTIPCWWQEMREARLWHARQHCDIYIDTTDMTPSAVAAVAIAALGKLGIPRAIGGQGDECSQMG